MKAIDLAVGMSTKRGEDCRDPALRAELASYFRYQPTYKTDEEMINDFREANVKVVLSSATYEAFGWKDFGEVKDRHDYLAHLKRDYPDVILGAWVGIEPQRGTEGLKELERCIKDLGTFGVVAFGAATGIPVNDKRWYPIFDICSEAGTSVKITVGFAALHAGRPGGGGIRLFMENPIPFLDDVAAKFPKLTIIAHHMAWPFHEEMTAVLIHKGNVYNEVHGYLPRHFPETLKREINTRIQDKVMFGSDYPMFSYQRLFQDWEDQGYKAEVLEKVYYKNAQRVLGLQPV